MSLTDIKVKNARPKDKLYKLFDMNGLYLLITPSGGKWWRFDYLYQKKRKTISLGTYPKVSLREARQKRGEAKQLLADGIDPSGHKKSAQPENMTFGQLAMEWFENKKEMLSERYVVSVKQRIEKYIIPSLGEKIAASITAPEIYKVLHEIELLGTYEITHKVRQVISMIFRYGIVKGVVERDPASDLGKGVLIPVKRKHQPALLEPKAIGALIRAIDNYPYIIARCAMQLLALTFVRPGELRKAAWREIDFEGALWEIPAERMKLKRPHIVPLSRQALGVLRTIHFFTGNGIYVFPSNRGKDRPISDMTINAALQRMGYNTREEITAHGFRAMARTLLHEKLRFPPEVIEHQLSHVVPDILGEAYNRTRFIDERKRMMQVWADYLYKLKELR